MKRLICLQQQGAKVKSDLLSVERLLYFYTLHLFLCQLRPVLRGYTVTCGSSEGLGQSCLSSAYDDGSSWGYTILNCTTGLDI